MSTLVYRITTLLSSLLRDVPVGTNLALFYLLWTLLSGRLLASRGAVIPALAAMGLPAAAVRRAWAALAYGKWETPHLLVHWEALVQAEGQWQAHVHGGYRPVAADLVGFFRPRLVDCLTRHYSSQAGKALPAIPFGMLARIGSVGSQRLPLPCRLVRLPPGETREAPLAQQLLREAAALLADDEALCLDGGFSLAQVLETGVGRFVVRGAQNFTARRDRLPAAKPRGRPNEYGEIVRPLPRSYKEHLIPATPPDRQERFLDGEYLIQVRIFEGLVLPDAKPGAPTFTCVVFFDPRYKEPLLLVTNLSVPAQVCWALYRDRWPIEQWPLAGKQMVGAVRQFVFAGESRHRLPELALLAGAILSYVAATEPAISTGFWDRAPKPTAGRLRRALAGVDFSNVGGLPANFRKKASPTAHLPKGVLGHRRQKRRAPNDEGLRLAA
jgi:hypothetical protein